MVPADPPFVRSRSFGPALVEATRHVCIGVLVTAAGSDGYRVEFANERVCALFGRSPRRVPEDFGFDEESAERIGAFLLDTRAAPLVLDDVRCHGPGAEGLLRVVASRTNVGGRAAAVLFFYDASANLRAEHALAESEARFRRLLDAAPDAIALGTRARFLYANPACIRLLGYSRMEEVTGVPVLQHLSPEDRPAALRIVAGLLGAPKKRLPARLRLVRKDSRVVQVDIRSIAIEWDGEPAFLGIARDLTERHRDQAQLIRADRLAAMGTLAAGVAHEINNPLAYLMLNLQYLMRELPRFDGDSVRLEGLLERLAEAEHGARRVSTIVGDLRTLARPEQVGHGPVSVVDAVHAALKVLGAQLRHRAKVVEVYEKVGLVNANATRLEQVFVNLLANAAHSLPEGRPEENEVCITVRSDRGRVIVDVKDTGIGIAPDTLDRIFDPFFTTKPRGLGTGLGLPISRAIVKSLGGEIGVTSVFGEGSTFSVTIPGLTESEAPPPRRSQTPPPSLSRPPQAAPRRARVLVVDDEPLVADMLQRTLAEAHDVKVATDAQTALDFLLSGETFDIIFCDLLMPRMSGMDLYEALRARFPGIEERIVFMTGGAFTERAAQFLATVPNRKLTKPFDLVELERIVTVAAGGET
jgi:two-component system cell cycle sensor histidine kinase/response regulator CckA